VIREVIHPDEVFDKQAVIKLLNLKESGFRSEVRAGRLRVSRRLGRYWITGADILAWLRSGTIKPRRSTPMVEPVEV
jgi:hypothetical protein